MAPEHNYNFKQQQQQPPVHVSRTSAFTHKGETLERMINLQEQSIWRPAEARPSLAHTDKGERLFLVWLITACSIT